MGTPIRAAALLKSTTSNDGTIRDLIWRRYAGDDWAAFDQLPSAVRRRLSEHAYDAWSVNALMLWRHYRRLYPTPERAQRALLRYVVPSPPSLAWKRRGGAACCSAGRHNLVGSRPNQCRAVANQHKPNTALLREPVRQQDRVALQNEVQP